MGVSDFGVICGRLVYKLFNHFTSVPMKSQNETLAKIMKKNKNTEYGKKYHFDEVHTLDDFRKNVPLTTYEDYDEYVDRMINGREKNLITAARVQRYASSSGSVGKPKMMPKTGKDLFNMQCMGLCGVLGLAWQHYHDRGEKLGRLYGALVLVLTGKKTADGKEAGGVAQMPLSYLKPMFPAFSTSPIELLYPEHEEDYDIGYLQLRFALPAEDLSFLGAGVITLMTSMFELLEDKWQMLCDDIEKGTINESIKMPDDFRKKFTKKFKPNPKRANELRREFEKGFDTPIAPRIWPNLKFVYGMIGSNLVVYGQRLRHWIGDTPMHNVGFGAAEGFIAMPVEMNATDYCCLPKSLIYEFIPVDDDENDDPTTQDETNKKTGTDKPTASCENFGNSKGSTDEKTLLLNEIEVGKRYEIVLTNFSGLYRYRMFDVVEVTGMHNNTPMIELKYRRNLGMNITNEKTTTEMLDFAAEKFATETGIEFEGHSFYGDQKVNPPRYVFLFEPKTDIDMSKMEEYEQLLDKILRDVNEKIEKYRGWDILDMPVIKVLQKGTYDAYREMLRQRGTVLNQIKPVTIINNEERREFFFAHTVE